MVTAAAAASAVALRSENACSSMRTFSCRCVSAATAAASPGPLDLDDAVASAVSSARTRSVSAVMCAASPPNTPEAAATSRSLSAFSSAVILDFISAERLSCALRPSRAVCASLSAFRVD